MTQRSLWSDVPLEDQTSLPVAHSAHAIATHHSYEAAVKAMKTRPAKSLRLLELVNKSGTNGLTDHELAKATGWPLSSVCSIRNGVRVLLWPADREALSPYSRNVTAWRLATAREVSINRAKDAQQLTLEARS